MEVWFAPFDRVRQSGYSSRSLFGFLCEKALIQNSIQISMELEKATTVPPKAHLSIVMSVSAYRSRESLIPYDLYQTCLLQQPFCFSSFGAVSRCFTDTKCWTSLCLLIMKVYSDLQIHEPTMFSYFLV